MRGDDVRLGQRLQHNRNDVALVAVVHLVKDHAVGEGTAKAGNRRNTHRQTGEAQHGGQRHRAQRRGADHLHDTAQQEAHNQRGLLCSCGDGAADDTQYRVDRRVYREGNQAGNRCDDQRAGNQVKAGRQVFFNVRSDQANDVAGDEARQDAVAAAGQTRYNREDRVCAHADRNHDARCHAAQAASGGTDLCQESDTQQVTGDIFMNSFYQEGSNRGVGHTGHRLAALWEF